MRRPAGMRRSRIAPLLAALLLSAPPLTRTAGAQQPVLPADSATLLMREGEQAWLDGHAASVRRAIALWDQARAVAVRRNDRAAQAEALLRAGRALGALSVHDTAAAYLGEALALGRASGDRAGEARTLVELARVHLATGRTAAARARADSALALAGALPRSTADEVEAGARTIRGVALRLAARVDSARAELRRALALRRRAGDRRGEGEALQVLGDVYRIDSQYDSAFASYNSALALQERAGDLRGAAWTHRGAAVLYDGAMQRDLQIEHSRRALAGFVEAGDRRGQALALVDVARYHRRNGAVDSATAAARGAVARAREIGDRPSEANALMELGVNLMLAGRNDSVGVYMREALDRARGSGDVWLEVVALKSLAEVYDAAGQDSAVDLYRAAVAKARAARLAVLEAPALQSLATLLAVQGQLDSAQAGFARAAWLARSVGDRLIETWAVRGEADIARTHGGHQGLRSAVALYDSAAWALSTVVAGVGGDRDRLGMVGAEDGPWGDWALTWLARAEYVGAAAAQLAALAASERGRAQALLLLMRHGSTERAGTQAVNVPPPGADLPAEGRALLRRAREGGQAVIMYQVVDDTLLRWLLPPAGEPRFARSAIAPDTLAALVVGARAMLGADEASGRGVGGRRAVELEEPMPAGAPYRGALQRLAALLLPDSLDRLLPAGSEVVLIPAGVLNLVPFAALPLPGGDYLGARHPLRYAPSLTTLAQAEARPVVRRGELSRALVVGNPAMPTITTYTGEEVELDPLPGAAREADEVAARLGARALHETAASETGVLTLLPDAPLVHLATHGFAYSAEDRAQDSFVALAPGGGANGLLTVSEVLSQPGPMHAELVVLSACQSGLGNLQNGEGTVGLQRAFLARGARSVLVSLWSVSDRATEALMRGFYTHWLNDRDHPGKAEALRRAQADVRAMPGLESPLYWAAFQLAGAR
ncbi:MAG TPA: CHAT domain-containing protein [Longimicrobium sp.]|nr:CHAT domain-containing protein [Longimicrobium sp.]